MRTIGSSQVSVFPLCLGSNIFGWAVDDGELRRLSSAAAPVTA